MDRVRYLVVGAGVTGLAFANYLGTDELLILERDDEVGGYCKTVVQDGFVWDYSGHFFHFRHPEIERFLVDRMPADEVTTIVKSAKIRFKDRLVDFPFQKNIHQLPQDDLIDCLYHLVQRPREKPTTFKEMVYARFGQGIAERFLVPYNEKLYACDLDDLDADAMGRFFPYADLEQIIRNFREPDNRSYNDTFTYPRGGAIQYIRALELGVPSGAISLGEPLVALDPARRVATTPKREICYDRLVSSAPLNRLLELAGAPVEPGIFRWNKVLVFNLGFDRKGWSGGHWLYFPEREYVFYRVGFYDNIFATDRMSLYVEIGFGPDVSLDVEALRPRVLADLEAAGIVEDHRLVSHHAVVLDPAYVHVTGAGQRAAAEAREWLRSQGIYSAGRYGRWTYCSIEDNIVEARDLAALLRAEAAG